jgi:hypothetical protein
MGMRLELPQSWKDVTLEQVQGIMQTDNELERLAILANTTVQALKGYPAKLVQEGLRHVNGIQEVAEFSQRLQIDGVKYGFVPDWDEFTAGEYIDLEMLVKDFWPNAARVMAVLYRPITSEIGGTYKVAPYTAKEDPTPFLKVPAHFVSGMLVFFWTTRNELANSTAGRLLEAAQVLQQPSRKSGVGIRFFTRLRAKAFWQWRPSPKNL